VSQIIAITIAVIAAALITPLIEFCWNFYRAPIRILKEENKALREQISKYESSSAKNLIKINGEEYSGTWYGNKFVLDEPAQILHLSTEEENLASICYVPCPPNSLAELRYNLKYSNEGGPYWTGGNASIAIGIPGYTKEPMLTGTGKETLNVGKNCEAEISLHNGMGFAVIIDVYLIGWEKYGNR